MVQSNLVCLAADSTLSETSKDMAELALAETPKDPAELTLTDPLLTSLDPTAAPALPAVAADAPASAVAIRADAIDDGKEPILENPLLAAAGAPPSSGYVLSGGAQASPDECPDRIDQLTKNILLKEIELERFNLNYTQNVGIQGRWKSWRYNGLQEVNGAMGLTGAIISVAYRGARLEDAKKVKPCIQESGNYIPMIGAYIGAGASAMEFGINGYHDLVARHRGYSPHDSVAKVSGIKNEIDKMMAERNALTQIEATSAALSGQTQLDIAEGKVLEDLLNESLKEFERFHVGARRLIAFQQSQYLLDISKYVINALGYNFAFLSLHDHHRRYNGNAGALFMTSGGIMMMAPIVSRFIGKGVAELTRANYVHAVGHGYKAGGSTLEADLASLDTLTKGVKISNAERGTARCLTREGHYEEHSKTFTNEIRAAQKARGAAVLSATQNVGSAIYVGGSKVASGVCFGIVGFNHIYHAGSDSIEADRVTNDDLFVASLIAIPATAYSMLDTLRITVKGEIARHKLLAKGMLPRQIVALRLQQLDSMEQKLKTGQ